MEASKAGVILHLKRRISRQSSVIVLAILLAFALGIRLYGLSFGLPYRYHIDETFYVAGALRIAHDKLNVPLVYYGRFRLPITPHGPNPFYAVLAVEYGLYFVAAWLSGTVASVAAFEQSYRSNPTTFVLLARLTSAAAGAMTLVPVYLIAKRLKGRKVGIVSAIMLACAFQHVRESHYGTAEVFAGLIVTLCLLACLEAARGQHVMSSIACGVLAGVAAGTKFTNALLWVPILIAHTLVIQDKREKRLGLASVWIVSRNLLVAALSFGLAFAVSYPMVLLRPEAFLEYLRFLTSVGETGYITEFRIEPAPAGLYYLKSLASWGLGWIIISLVGLGAVLAASSYRLSGKLLLGFILAYVAFLSRAPYYQSRYLIPLLPVLCVLAALAIAWLVDKFRQHIQAELAYVLIIGVSVLQPLAFSLRHDYLLTRTDTRTIAKEWIEANIAAGTKIALDWQKHAPPLRTMEDAFPTTDVQYDIMVADGIGLPRYSLADYRAAGVGYLIMSSFIDDQILSSPADVEARRAFHEMLDSSCELVYEVRPYAGANKPPFVFDQIFGPVTALWQFERPGPAIKIYRIP